MCGIGGFKRCWVKGQPDPEPIQREWVDSMLVALEPRGNDATGLAFLKENDPDLYWIKQDMPAWQFISSNDYKNYMDKNFDSTVTAVILHTRAATVGSPRKDENNHPMVFERTAVVHNGGISNHEYLFKDLKLTRHAETDSDILRAMLDAEGMNKVGIRRIARCNGSVACAALDPQEPEKLLLVRSGSPLVLAEYGNILVWASEKGCIYKSMREWVNKFGLDFSRHKPGGHFLNMADHTAWLFDKEGLIWHDECKTSFHYVPPARHVYDNYQSRQRRWDAEQDAKRVEIHPAGVKKPKGQPKFRCEHCHKVNTLSAEALKRPLEEVECGNCNQKLKKAVA